MKEKDKLSQIVFSEGSEMRKLTGEIIGSEDNFLVVKTLSRIFKINKLNIVKIEEQLEGSEKNG